MPKLAGLLGCAAVVGACGSSDGNATAGAAAGPAASGEAEVARSPSGYPERAVLDAFRGGCSDLTSLDAAVRAVRPLGWRRIAEPESSPVGGVIAAARSPEIRRQLEQMGAREGELAAFERDVAGERLHLVIANSTFRGRDLVGCRLYDLEERRQIGAATLREWAGRAEVERTAEGQALILTWRPGFVPGSNNVEYFFVPQGSPTADLFGVSGIVLKTNVLNGAAAGQ